MWGFAGDMRLWWRSGAASRTATRRSAGRPAQLRQPPSQTALSRAFDAGALPRGVMHTRDMPRCTLCVLRAGLM